MSDMQLTFLSAEPSAFDVNAIDDGIIRDTRPYDGSAAQFLALRPVDDCVFGLGFTNWKAVIDQALRSAHFELFTNADGWVGLRKHGYRYAPIPRLPVAGATYVQQRLLSMAAERSGSLGRHDKMVSVSDDFAHKVVVEQAVCSITARQEGSVIRATLSIDQLAFSDTAKNDPNPITLQLVQVLVNAGAAECASLLDGCRSIATHILRIAQGVR